MSSNTRQTLREAERVRLGAVPQWRQLHLAADGQVQVQLPEGLPGADVQRRRRRVPVESVPTRRHVREHARLIPVSTIYIRPYM